MEGKRKGVEDRGLGRNFLSDWWKGLSVTGGSEVIARSAKLKLTTSPAFCSSEAVYNKRSIF